LLVLIAIAISNMVGHYLSDWGDDAEAFRPERWLPDPETPEKVFHGNAPVSRGVFSPFGGGKHLCPGRNFAQTELWGTLVALACGFDFTGADGDPPKVPERTNPDMTSNIGVPVDGSDLRICVKRRKGWENVVFKAAL
jgi:cytochrome P450